MSGSDFQSSLLSNYQMPNYGYGSNFNFNIPNDGRSLAELEQQAALANAQAGDQGLMSLQGLSGISQGVGAIGSLASAYNGWQQNKLAEKSVNSQIENNRDNFNMQVKNLNRQLSESHAGQRKSADNAAATGSGNKYRSDLNLSNDAYLSKYGGTQRK